LLCEGLYFTFPELKELENRLYENPTQELVSSYNREYNKTMRYIQQGEQGQLPKLWAQKIYEEYRATGKWTHPFLGAVYTTAPDASPVLGVGVENEEAKMLIAVVVSGTIMSGQKTLRGVQREKLKKERQSETFSHFTNRYVAEEMEEWQTKGEYEKTADYQTRVNEETRRQKTDELTYKAIEAYAKQIMEDVFYEDNNYYPFFSSSAISENKYDADKETYYFNMPVLGTISLKMSADEARNFPSYLSDDGINSKRIDNIVFFIRNDKLELAMADFVLTYFSDNVKRYRYVNSSPEAQKQIERKAQEYINRGNDYLKSDNYWRAIINFERVGRYPTAITENADFYSKLGDIYFQYKNSGRHAEGDGDGYYSGIYSRAEKKAVEAYEKAITFDPNNAALCEKLGDAFIKDYKKTKAIESYEKAILLDSDNVTLYEKLGSVFFKDEQWSKVIEAYEKIVSLNPNSSTALHNIGVCYTKLRDKKKAKEFFTQAAQLGDSDAQENLKNWKQYVKRNF
jgi:tetratricopeptide (TPR) repeat protein